MPYVELIVLRRVATVIKSLSFLLCISFSIRIESTLICTNFYSESRNKAVKTNSPFFFCQTMKGSWCVGSFPRKRHTSVQHSLDFFRFFDFCCCNIVFSFFLPDHEVIMMRWFSPPEVPYFSPALSGLFSIFWFLFLYCFFVFWFLRNGNANFFFSDHIWLFLGFCCEGVGVASDFRNISPSLYFFVSLLQLLS